MCDTDPKAAYGIEVGRWTGMFAMLWYSDVYNATSARRETTFTAWTRRGARKKALRYVARETGGAPGSAPVIEEHRIRW